MFAADSYFGAQFLTIMIPLGTLIAVCLWGFFQRPSEH
jgi:hypothetical protein